MTKLNACGTDGNVSWLHSTVQEAEMLFRKETEGTTLTDLEKAIVNLQFTIEFAVTVRNLMTFTEQDLIIGGEQKALWNLGCQLSEAPTLGVQAFGYNCMLAAIIETPGALEGALTKVRKNLTPVPPDARILSSVMDTILATNN